MPSDFYFCKKTAVTSAYIAISNRLPLGKSEVYAMYGRGDNIVSWRNLPLTLRRVESTMLHLGIVMLDEGLHQEVVLSGRDIKMKTNVQ